MEDLILVIDSTGRDYDMIARNHNMLQQMNYDCYMTFVNTSLEVALDQETLDVKELYQNT